MSPRRLKSSCPQRRGAAPGGRSSDGDRRSHVIEVLPLYYDFSPPVVVDVNAWSEEALHRLRAFVPETLRASCEVREIVVRGKPYQEILALADSLNPDLIVMGVHGRGAVDLFFLGSTTHHVVRHARCAVLTLRT